MTAGLHRARERIDAATEYLRDETIGGIVLLAGAAAALVWANVGDNYLSFWHTDLTLGVGSLSITEDFQHWVNDGLMVLFFFIVALEVKREFVTGELRDRKAATLPVLAALGGVVLPAVIFVTLTLGTQDAHGWAIPAATDIAFAVGVLVPLFALANAGIVISGDTISAAASSRVAWAIALGLVLGKLVGIAGTALLVHRRGIGRLPDNVTTRHVWGIAALGGIGFTVSLFIGQLAYADPATVDTAKFGIFAGSIIAATIGVAILRNESRSRP